MHAISDFTDLPQLAVTERAAAPGTRWPTVVFLHGLGCERGQFAKQWAGLDGALSLLCPDLPGHGESPELNGAHSIESMAAAVASELRARGLVRVVLVGHSAGGLIALRLAIDNPVLVRGVVVLDSTTALSDAELTANRDRAVRSEAGDWRGHFMASMADAWGDDDGEAGPFRSRVFGALERVSERVARPLWNEVLTLEPESLWRRCSVPSLYVRSRRDTDLTRLRQISPLIATVDLRPRCRGHWPHLQCPDPVNRTILTFTESTEHR